jgi:hypothetical protein
MSDNEPTWDRPMFDLGIRETGTLPEGEYPSGEKYGGEQYVAMKCGCEGNVLYLITKDSDPSWGWAGTDFFAMGWCGCNIHFYDDNGDMEDEAELMTANVEQIAEIMQRRNNKLN